MSSPPVDATVSICFFMLSARVLVSLSRYSHFVLIPPVRVASHSLARQADEIGGYDAQETLEFVKTLASHPLWCRDAVVQCSPCTIITRHCRYKHHPDREKDCRGWGRPPPEPHDSSPVCKVRSQRRHQHALITLAPAHVSSAGNGRTSRIASPNLESRAFSCSSTRR